MSVRKDAGTGSCFFFTEIVRTCVLTDNLDRRYYTVILNKNSSFRQLNGIYITPPPRKKNITNKSKTKQKRMAERKQNTFKKPLNSGPHLLNATNPLFSYVYIWDFFQRNPLVNICSKEDINDDTLKGEVKFTTSVYLCEFVA